MLRFSVKVGWGRHKRFFGVVYLRRYNDKPPDTQWTVAEFDTAELAEAYVKEHGDVNNYAKYHCLFAYAFRTVDGEQSECLLTTDTLDQLTYNEMLHLSCHHKDCAKAVQEYAAWRFDEYEAGVPQGESESHQSVEVASK
jgi:hypothetical protein